MKKIIGRQTKFGYIVELEKEGLMTRLSLAKSLQVVKHSSEGFRWGDSSPGSAQLSAAILYEVTNDADMSRQYYQLFLSDCVEKWIYIFEINEFQIKRWLRNKGEEKYMVDMANIMDAAKADFNEFNGLHRILKKVYPVEQEQQMIPLCESVILRSSAWVENYKCYILELPRAEYGPASEGYTWMPMLEGIRDQLPFFTDLLYDQQLDHHLLEVVEEIRREVMELLAEHIYWCFPF